MTLRYKFRILILGVLALLTAMLALLIKKDHEDVQIMPARLKINEVCSSNFSAVADDSGNYPDYVELYNPSDSLFEGNIYLSDDGKDLKKFVQYVKVPSKEFLVVRLYGSEAVDPSQAAFGLSRNGDKVFLSNDEGFLMDVISLPALPYDTSFGRVTDGEAGLSAMSCTCGYSNEGAETINIEFTAEPYFSLVDGYYPEGTELEIYHLPWERVYYTMDSSIPDESSTRYTGAIELTDASDNDNVYADSSMYLTYMPPDYKVDKINVVRAIKTNMLTGEKSRVATHVYIVGFEDKKKYENIPVMSLVIDPKELFDPVTGLFVMGERYELYKEMGGFTGLSDEEIPSSFIADDGNEYWRMYYTNSNIRGRESEREVQASYFADRDLLFSQKLGVRVAGESSRYEPQKSLNLFSREIYDNSRFLKYDFWGMDTSKVRLRKENGYINYKASFVQSLMGSGSVPYQRSKPVVLFLDGEYWGAYGINEQYTEDYFQGYFGISPENLWFIKNDEPEYGGQEAIDSYHYHLDVLQSSDASDEEVYSMICDLVDIDNLIDYYCFLIYFDNEDIEARHNQALYRGKDGGKWRYVLYDMDVTCGAAENNTIDFYRSKDDNMYIPGLLCVNSAFRKAFRDRMYELMDGQFSYENIHGKLLEWDEMYREQAIETRRRFDGSDFDEGAYDRELKELDDFFKYRRGYVQQYLEEDLANY